MMHILQKYCKWTPFNRIHFSLSLSLSLTHTHTHLSYARKGYRSIERCKRDEK